MVSGGSGPDRSSGGGTGELAQLWAVVDGDGLRRTAAEVERAHVEASVADYLLDLVAATRSHPRLLRGANPRASQILLRWPRPMR